MRSSHDFFPCLISLRVPLTHILGSPHAHAAALQKLEEMQVKDTLRMINNMVELCFSECVSGFRSKVLTSPEEKCVNTCAEKFLKHSGRVGQRFGELWMAEPQAQTAQQ